MWLIFGDSITTISIMENRLSELSVLFCLDGTVNYSKWIDAISHWCFLGRVRKEVSVLHLTVALWSQMTYMGIETIIFQ